MAQLGVRPVVQGDPVELALVDVGHLVVLPPNAAGGCRVQHVVEPVSVVHFRDLHFLRVTGKIVDKYSGLILLPVRWLPIAASVVMPRLPYCIFIQNILCVVKARITVHDAAWSYLKIEIISSFRCSERL